MTQSTTTQPAPDPLTASAALRSCHRNLLAAWLDITNLTDRDELGDKISAAITHCERLQVVVEGDQRAEAVR